MPYLRQSSWGIPPALFENSDIYPSVNCDFPAGLKLCGKTGFMLNFIIT